MNHTEDTKNTENGNGGKEDNLTMSAMHKAVKKLLCILRSRLGELGSFFEGSSRTPRQKLGQKAEDCIAERLRRDGYAILQRNYTTKAGEIDIIAFRRGTIAFVEVRSRTGRDQYPPEESVNYPKQKKIISTARHYAAANLSYRDQNPILRFDVATVTFNSEGDVTEIRYYEDAFRPD